MKLGGMMLLRTDFFSSPVDRTVMIREIQEDHQIISRQPKGEQVFALFHLSSYQNIKCSLAHVTVALRFAIAFPLHLS